MPLVLRVGRPERAPGERETWSCPVEVAGNGEVERRRASGADAVQALFLGLVLGGVILRARAGRAGRLTQAGAPFLGLPDEVDLQRMYGGHDVTACSGHDHGDASEDA